MCKWDEVYTCTTILTHTATFQISCLIFSKLWQNKNPDEGLNLVHSDAGACKHVHIFYFHRSLLQHVGEMYIGKSVVEDQMKA